MPHFPQGACACGGDLAAARDLGVRYSHQVTDLPEARAQTTQPTGTRWNAPAAAGHGRRAAAGGGAGHGDLRADFQAWCVFLMVMHHVPVERCADILESMTGTRPSDGWVPPCWPGRRKRSPRRQDDPGPDHPDSRGLRRRDPDPVRPRPEGEEEVPARRLPSLLTCYFLGERSLSSFKDFVYPDLHGTVVVHDRYKNYDHFEGVSHQLCCAHLLRDLEDAAQVYPDAIGLPRSPASCALSSTRPTSPASRAWPPCPKTRSRTPQAVPYGALAGLSEVRRVPGATRSSHRPGSCWNASKS